MSADLYPSVVEFAIGELPLYSDHCPLHLAVNLINDVERKTGKHSYPYTKVNETPTLERTV